MSIRTIELVSSRPIPKYGDKVLTLEQLEELAALYNSGPIQLNLHHDLAQPWDATIVAARMIVNGEGFHAVMVDLEADDDELNLQIEASLLRGGTFGLSCVVTEEIACIGSGDVAIEVFAENECFDDSTIISAGDDLASLGAVVAGRYFQFGIEAPMKVAFNIAFTTLVNVPPAVLAQYLVDVLFGRFKKPDGRLPVVDIRCQTKPDGSSQWSLQAYTEQSARTSIEEHFAMLRESLRSHTDDEK